MKKWRDEGSWLEKHVSVAPEGMNLMRDFHENYVLATISPSYLAKIGNTPT